jgi:hypothetical protein
MADDLKVAVANAKKAREIDVDHISTARQELQKLSLVRAGMTASRLKPNSHGHVIPALTDH